MFCFGKLARIVLLLWQGVVHNIYLPYIFSLSRMLHMLSVTLKAILFFTFSYVPRLYHVEKASCTGGFRMTTATLRIVLKVDKNNV